MKYFRPILILYFLISGVWGTSAQTASSAAIFGKNWIQAQQLVEKHQDWMQKECSIFRVDFPLAVSGDHFADQAFFQGTCFFQAEAFGQGQQDLYLL